MGNPDRDGFDGGQQWKSVSSVAIEGEFCEHMQFSKEKVPGFHQSL